jgi:type II secretory pathway component PulJ
MKRLNTGGFTVVELAISVVVTGILMVAVFYFMTNGLVDYTSNLKHSELLNSAQVGFDVVTNDIRLSANADTANRWADTNAPSGDYSWASNSDTLVLAKAAENSSGDIIFSDPAEYISYKNNVVYFLQGSNLYRRVIAGPVSGNTAKTTCPASSATDTCPADKVVLENIDSLTFRYADEQNATVTPDDARSVEMTAKLEDKAYGQTVTVTYTTRMVFRND